MGMLTCGGMRALEEAAFRRGVSPEALMDEAGRRLGLCLSRLFPVPGTAVAYLGRGHNGGDALVALRILREAGWRIAVRSAHAEPALAVLTRRKLRELEGVVPHDRPFAAEGARRPLLLLDGLLGIGARGALREPLSTLAAEMDHLRKTAGATVVAVDLPSGLAGDSGEPSAGAVRADLTITIGVPKTGLVADGAIDHVGRLEVVALAELPPPAEGDRVVTGDSLRAHVPPRPFDTHKGTAGRVGIVAGSRGLLGAALLTATGALRGGGGLVSLFVPEEIHELFVAAGPPPELMIKPLAKFTEVLHADLDVLAIGPGLGRPAGVQRNDLLTVLTSFAGPLVVDADALNLAAEVGPDAVLHGGMVVTPHPGELARLFPEAVGVARAVAARRFVERHPCTLLLKGARTIVTAPGEPLFYNSTGTPGMATGGQGDVLTGVIAALVAGGLPPLPAAQTGAWLCGRAAELALTVGRESEQSLLAGDTARRLGAAFRELREGF